MAVLALSAILLPPFALDHAPNPPMRVYRHEMSISRLNRECRELGGPDLDYLACSLRLGDGACIEILPAIGAVTASVHRKLERHEDGHCNEKTPNLNHEGWR